MHLNGHLWTPGFLERRLSSVCASLHVHMVSVGWMFERPEEFSKQEHRSLEAVFFPPFGYWGLPARPYHPATECNSEKQTLWAIRWYNVYIFRKEKHTFCFLFCWCDCTIVLFIFYFICNQSNTDLNDQNKVFLFKKYTEWLRKTVDQAVLKPLLIFYNFCIGLDNIKSRSARLKNPLSKNWGF